jgi:hypothetical protein
MRRRAERNRRGVIADFAKAIGMTSNSDTFYELSS